MRTDSRRFAICAAIVAATLLMAAAPVSAQSIRTNPEFNQYSIPANDDGSSELVPLGFTVNFFGRIRTSVYVNNNGNVTFDDALPSYTPFGLQGTKREIIAAFFADVDTRPKTSKLVTYGRAKINDHAAFGVNYVNVGYYNVHADKFNSFQLILIDRSDTGAGNFDIEFNYGSIRWETGDASGGTNGYGGVSASVGWSNGSGDPGTSWEMAGSLIPGSFLDSSPRSLVNTRYNSTTVGRFQFRARGGVLIPGLAIQTGCPVPNAFVGAHYQYRLEAIGENGPYSWALLPDPGMTLPITVSSSGVLSGDPVTTGTYNFTVQVTAKTDDGSVSVAKRCSLTVAPPQLSIRSACPLPEAVAGAAYSQSLSVAGGTAPYTWTLLGNNAPGLILNSNGTLAGTPVAAGTYPFMLRVVSSDTGVEPATRQCVLVVRQSAPTPTVSACPAGSATAGVPYAQTLGVSGGAAPYNWSLAGQLPAGLSLSRAGVISGIPTVAAPYVFDVVATDARGQSARQSCAIAVSEPSLTLVPGCPLPAATAGLTYSQQLQALGGAAPYVWSVAVGTLPAGLRLSSDGLLSGTPSAAGPYLFRLVATDAQGWATGMGCSLSVARPSFSISNCPLPSGITGKTYAASMAAIGGQDPYLWTLDGSLPAGLTLSSSGAVTGTPTAGGDFSFTVRTVDGRGQTASQACGLTIEPPMPKVASDCPLPRAEVGKAYSVALAAEGGTPPYRWMAPGNLPAGFRLGNDGTLSGVPTEQGNYEFTLLGADARNRSIVKDCSLAVSLPATPAIRTSDIPAVVAPASSNISAGVELSAPYNMPVQGTATVAVTPETGADGELNRADPMVRFANNQQTTRFTIPAGTRAISIPILSSGTVASTVVFTVNSLEVAGNRLNYPLPSRVFSVPRAAPTMTSACFTSKAAGIELTITGYSTTRQIDSAEVTLDGKAVWQSLKPASWDYYSNDASIRTGGAFSLTLPIATTTPNPSSVAVTLSNSAGTSASKAASRCQ